MSNAVPVNAVPVDTEPVDTEPVNAVPVDTDPVDTEPVNTEPVNTRVLLLGGRLGLVRKARDAGLSVVNVQKPSAYDPELEQLCEAVHQLDYQDIAAVTELAERLHAEAPFVQVISQTEAAQLVTGYLNTRLGLPGNSFDVVSTLHDKRILRELLNAAGLGVVPMVRASSRADIEDFINRHGACVIKPAMGSGSLGVRKLSSLAELDRDWPAMVAFGLTEFMIEQLLVGLEYSVETLSSDGQHRVVAITEKQTGDGVVELGHRVPGRLSDQQATEVNLLTCRALQAVGLINGAAHTEVIVTESGPRVVEAHSRRAGDRITDLIELVYGIDLERLAFEQVRGGLALPTELPAIGNAAISFLTCEPGRIREISGVSDALAARGVVAVRLTAEAGRLVAPLAWSEDRCGYVMSYARDGIDAMELAERGAELISITVDPAETGPAPTLNQILDGISEVLDPFAAPTSSTGTRAPG